MFSALFSAFLLAQLLTPTPLPSGERGRGEGGGGKLEILNARPTFGHLGARRPATGMLPGDTAYFSFDVKNLQVDKTGRASYSIAFEIRDEDGKLVFDLKPQNSVAQNFFGGNVLPCSSFIEVPLDIKPGAMSWKLTVQDRKAGTSAVLEGKGKVLSPDFGLVQVGTFADPEARVPTAPVGLAGGNLYIHFATVGFARDAKTKQPDIEVTLRFLDDRGKPTMPNPLKGEVNKDVPADLRLVAMNFGVTLNRPGTFTAELQGRCRICGKTATVSFPVRILPHD